MTRRDDAGNVMIWTLGMVLVIAVLGWLAIGLWSAFAERRDLAAAADQAAQSGATAFDTETFRNNGIRQLDPELAEQRALDSLVAQDLGPLEAVVVEATTERVVVVLESDVELGLLSLLEGDDEPFRVRVTAIGVARE